MKNPILDEIHKFRKKNSAKFNNDLDLIVKDLKKYEKSKKLKLVSLIPKSAKKQSKAA